jgi:hypothetical protein
MFFGKNSGVESDDEGMYEISEVTFLFYSNTLHQGNRHFNQDVAHCKQRLNLLGCGKDR